MMLYDSIIQKGREEGREEIVLVGYKNGVSIQTLSLLTGYKVEEVRQIIESQFTRS